MATPKNISISIESNFESLNDSLRELAKSLPNAVNNALKASAKNIQQEQWAKVTDSIMKNAGLVGLNADIGVLEEYFERLNKQRGKLNIIDRQARDIDRLYAMLQWLGAHVSTAELKRMGLVPADVSDDMQCDVDWFLRTVADRADKFKAADKRLRGKKAEPDPGRLTDLTIGEMGFIMQARKEGMDPMTIAADIRKQRGKKP
jgi:hypothetical protein